MRRPDQAGVIRIVPDQLHIDGDGFAFEDHGAAADGELAHAPRTKTTADDNAFGVAPGLGLEKTADDCSELLGKFLDGALHDASSFRRAFGQDGIEVLLGYVLRRLVPQGVVVELAQGCPKPIKDLAEGTLTGFVPHKTVVVFDLKV